ncbi:MAG: PD-(D/E)XK nuclease family transposase [Prevotella sp.]|nr:PD-(D/E)XK nuclease family transposase [Prevotella sp.]
MDFIAETGIPCQFRTDIGFGLLEEEGSMLDDPTEQQGCDAKTQAKLLVPRKGRKSKNSKAKAWKLSGLQYGFEKMRVVFLQLPLFEKKEPECMEIFDCWIYVLNNMEHLKEIPFLDKYPVFRKLAAIGDLQKLTPEERDYYEEDVKIMRDLYATDKWEKEKRRMERETARKELEEATKKALTEGRAKGRAEGMLEVAKNLLSMHLPIIQIMQATGLTQEQINRLKN